MEKYRNNMLKKEVKNNQIKVCHDLGEKDFMR